VEAADREHLMERLETKHGPTPGYDYGTSRATHSPVTLDDLRALERAVGWTAQDAEALKMGADVLSDQAEALVDSWRAQIGAQPQLAKWFVGPDGKPDEAYKAAVKRRFVQSVATLPNEEAPLVEGLL
jgi:hypothetical protein